MEHKNRIKGNILFTLLALFAIQIAFAKGLSRPINQANNVASNDSVYIFLKQAEKYKLQYINRLLPVAQKAKRLAQKGDNAWALHKANTFVAIAIIDTGNIALGVSMLLQAQKWFEAHQNLEDAGLCHFHLGKTYNLVVKNDSALYQLEQSLRIHRKVKDLEMLKKTFEQLGSVYHRLKNMDKSMAMTDSTIYYCKKTNDKEGLLGTQSNKASNLFVRGKLKEGLAISKEVLRLREETKSMGSAGATLLSNMGLAYNMLGDFKNAMYYAEYALKVSEEMGDERSIVAASGFLAHVMQMDNRFEEAIALFNKVLPRCKKIGDKDSWISMMNSKAHVHEILGQYDSAMSIHTHVFTEGIVQKMPEWEVRGYWGMGNAYNLRKDYAQSTDYYEKALRIAREIGAAQEVVKLLYAEARNLFDAKAYQKSEEYLLLVLEEIKKHPDYVTEMDAIISLAHLYLVLENFPKAMRFWEKIDKTQIQQAGAYSQSEYWLIEGQLLANQKKYSQSIVILKKALAASTQAKASSATMRAYSLLSEVSEESGNLKDALFFYKKATAAIDSVQNAENQKVVADLQAQYKLKQQENEIGNLQKDKEVIQLKAEKKSQEARSYIIGAIVVILFILSLGLTLFSRYRLKKDKEEARMAADHLLLQKENLIASRQVEMAEHKNEFYANISHEFRTPLTLIKAPLEKLLESESSEKDTYKMMLKNSDQLLEMINEILELSKSTERLDVLDKNSISIKDFMEELIHQFSPVSKAKEIRIHLDYQTERQVLIGDKKKLNMVFNNLIKNALENTPNGAVIGIVVKETQSDQWLFEFYNSGDQIPPKELPHLFDRYYRGDKNETEGNGIGLHICKEVIEQHHGSIEVMSNKIKTSFFVKLPGQVELQEKSLEKELSLQTTQVALEEQQDLDWSIGSDKPKLLIVEDHGEMRDFIKSGFQDDFTVILAKDGQEAMNKVHAQHPDLIISDVMMPNKDGFELTQHLKSKMETSHIPIILLTAKADTSSRIQGLELEADDYLLKPFHFKELELRARNILKQRKLLKEQFSSNPSLLKRAGRNPLDQAFLEKAQSIVLENLTKSDFSVQEFCEMLALNRTSVHQKFKALLEMSTSQFIRTVKVQRAKQLLEEGKLQLSEITSESGFNNRQNFAKAFKEQYGLSPSEYRDGIEERV